MKINNTTIITLSAKKPESSLCMVYTGGTLGMVHNNNGALMPFDFAYMLDHMPSIRQMGVNITVLSFEEPLDSSNVNPEHWKIIGGLIKDNYDEFDGFVVLHGTDTMAYTASALSFMLENLSKPVVFTGAQLPISSPRSDARENLISAIEIASTRLNGQPVVPEVCIYFHSVLLRGNRSKKSESVHFDAFNSENYPLLGETGVTIGYNYKFIRQIGDKPLVYHGDFDTNVAVLKLFPGMSESYVEAILSIKNLRGLIMETYGSGNAPTYPWFIELIKKHVEAGLIVLNISQCLGGAVLQGKYETSENLQRIGVISGADMTLEAAMAKMMLILFEEQSIENIRQRMTKSMSGELSII